MDPFSIPFGQLSTCYEEVRIQIVRILGDCESVKTIIYFASQESIGNYEPPQELNETDLRVLSFCDLLHLGEESGNAFFFCTFKLLVGYGSWGFNILQFLEEKLNLVIGAN